jgi:hypothetical protein
MMKMKARSILLGIGLIVGGLTIGSWPSPAGAVEMFTNFNDGMELGFRPYGIPEFAPIRYHSRQPQCWYSRHGLIRPSEDEWRFQLQPTDRPETAVPPPNVPGNQTLNDPIQLRGQPTAGVSTPPSDRNNIDWLQGASFLPRGSSD